ncbi:uncharacterized protein LOC127839525 [Dreissena polymorpha]|uniref:uncharacterized protein LOC127839525 n=1 Tax=Dreissena polymorpha TaxID=45954 RepID=UPI002263F4F2|nr:uncharacterized protein LOC127839525 [Dreissena polymorpha]
MEAAILFDQLIVGGCEFECEDNVRDLGVHVSSTLNFDLHIRKKCQVAYSQLRNLRCIRKHLTQNSIDILVHGLIHSQLDFCNGLFADIPAYQLNKLQRFQNTAARLVTCASNEERSSNLLERLHWLPVQARIMFKVLAIVFRVVKGTAPNYLRSMFTHAQGSYRLRSSVCIQLSAPRHRTKIADRSLEVEGPKWWNVLPGHLKSADSETTFKSKLKTYLFKRFHNT